MMQIRTPLDLGLAIRDRRRKLKLSQTELARKAGVGRQWVVAIEHGKVPCRTRSGSPYPFRPGPPVDDRSRRPPASAERRHIARRYRCGRECRQGRSDMTDPTMSPNRPSLASACASRLTRCAKHRYRMFYAQPQPISIRNASSSGRLARARTRCSIDISLSYSVASSPFRYVGQTASNAASHALASGGLRCSVPAKCLSRKHSWQIGCQMIENECFPAICRARSISLRYLALRPRSISRYRLSYIAGPPALRSSARTARSAIFPAPPPFMSRPIIETGTPSASARRLSHRTYPSSLLPSHATKTARLIRRYAFLRNLRHPAECAGQIVRVDVALPSNPPYILQAVD